MINLKINVEENKLIEKIKRHEKEIDLFLHLKLIILGVNGFLLIFL